MPQIKGFDVDEVLRGYIICALWAENDESTPSGGRPFDDNYGPEDLAPCARDQLRKDVVQFLELASETALSNYALHKRIDPSQGTVADYLGHDLWLTRNGHGAGFWDRDEVPEEARDSLTETSEELGQRDIYLGDDDRIYIF